MKSRYQKYIAVLVIGAVIVVQLSMPTNKAYAFFGIPSAFPTIEIPGPVIFLKNMVLDFLVRWASAEISRQLQNNLLDWFTEGGGKNVGFIGNMQKYFRELVDKGINEGLEQIDGVYIKDENLKKQIKNSIESNRSTIRQKLESTLAKELQLDRFYEGDRGLCWTEEKCEEFENPDTGDIEKVCTPVEHCPFGSFWEIFSQIEFVPQNNPIDAKQIAREVVNDHLQEIKKATERMLFGKDMLGGIKTVEEKCQVTGHDPETDMPIKKCSKETKVQTPGEFLTSTLNKNFNVGFDWAVSSDEFNELVQILIDGLFNQLTKSVNGLFGSDSGTFGIEDQLEPPDRIDDDANRMRSTLGRIDSTLPKIDQKLAELRQEQKELEEERKAIIRACNEAPIVTISASPQSVLMGGQPTINWESELAYDCTITTDPPVLDPPWTGFRGEEISPPLFENTTFRAECTGAVGNTTDSVTVGVTGMFDFNLTNRGADPNPINRGQSTSIIIDANLLSGSGQTIEFSPPVGLDPSMNYSYSKTSCTAPCSTTLTIRTTSSTPAREYNITISASSGLLSRNTLVGFAVSSDSGTPPGAPQADIVANGSDGLIDIDEGKSVSISWCGSSANDCSNASSCTVVKDGNSWQSGISGNYNDSPTIGTHTYTLTCTNSQSSNSDSVVVNVNASSLPPGAPEANITADKTIIQSGGSVTIKWCGSEGGICQNAANCSVTKNGTPWQTGTRGNYTETLTSSTEYILTCSNQEGDTRSDSVLINVNIGQLSINSITESCNSIRINLDRRAELDKRYELKQCSGRGCTPNLLADRSSGQAVIADNLNEVSWYTFSIEETDIDGNVFAQAGPIESKTKLCAPTLTAPEQARYGDSITLEWNSSPATSYCVGDQPTISYAVPFDTGPNNPKSGRVELDTLPIPSNTSKATRTYQLNCYAEDGSRNTDVANIDMYPGTILAQVDSISCSNTISSATISWNESAGADYYNILRIIDKNENGAIDIGDDTNGDGVINENDFTNITSSNPLPPSQISYTDLSAPPGKYIYITQATIDILAGFPEFGQHKTNSDPLPVTIPDCTLNNSRIRTTGDVNVRDAPTLNGSILATQPAGELGTTIGGPTLSDGYVWWQIEYDNGVSGWSVEDLLEIAAGG